METCPADIEEIHIVRSMTMFDKYLHIMKKKWL